MNRFFPVHEYYPLFELAVNIIPEYTIAVSLKHIIYMLGIDTTSKLYTGVLMGEKTGPSYASVAYQRRF